MNTFLEGLDKFANIKETENGGKALSSTLSKLYDMFAFGGAYRNRKEEDVIKLFKEAYDENAELALKCLFYLRDVRSGQGERRFFRICLHWLADYDTDAVLRNIDFISEMGRYDDYFALVGTKVEKDIFKYLKEQLIEDVKSDYPSLFAKWCPSINTSSSKTRALAKKFMNFMKLTPKTYRKTLSMLREKLNVLEKQMSKGDFSNIDFSKIPSKAGLQYRRTFMTREDTKERYAEFIASNISNVNVAALYPYEIVRSAKECDRHNSIEKQTLNKYWEALPNYLNSNSSKTMCVVDVSGSMYCSGYGKVAPIDVSVSLGIYTAERLSGEFKDKCILFSSNPRYITMEGESIVDKTRNLFSYVDYSSTDLIKTFELLRQTSLSAKSEDRLDTIIVISDMEIDVGSKNFKNENFFKTEMERERDKWIESGLQMPNLVYWNVNARNNTILESPIEGVSYVSGCSPSIFQSVLSGKTGYELMLETLLTDRYKDIK